jgi:hypothetical protein
MLSGFLVMLKSTLNLMNLLKASYQNVNNLWVAE